MISYRTLTEEDFSQVHRSLLEAFSDYPVEIKPTIDALRRLYLIEGVDFDLSVGAFDGRQMVGFTVNAVGNWKGSLTAYDAGTGVVPAYRRQGISRRMFEFILPRLRQNEVRQYLLEVITENKPALRLYKKLGFRKQRQFSVFKRHEHLTLENVRPDVEIVRVEHPDWRLFESFWNYLPSWQNSIDSVRRSTADETIERVVLVMLYRGEVIGYGIVFKRSGSIPQIAIARKYRGKGFGITLLNALQKHADRPLFISNVDHRAVKALSIFRSTGFSVLTTQYEMLLKL